MAWILLVLSLQDPTIPKQDRSTYLPVLEKFREAEAALAVDVLDCTRRCSDLIEDRTIKDAYREARVRLQNTDGSYGEWTVFAPFQLRGRAWMAQAKAAAGPEAADLAARAVKDLEESLRRGMKSSGSYLEQARALAGSLKPPAPPPDPRLAEMERVLKGLREKGDAEEVLRRCDAAAALLKGTAFEPEWRLLRQAAVEARARDFQKAWMDPFDEERFGAAFKVVESRGGFLADVDRASILARLRSRCADRFTDRLRETLVPGRAWTTLSGLSPAEFESRFALPDDPGLDWSRRCRGALERLRSSVEPSIADVHALAVEASAFPGEGENRAFAALEALVFDLTLARVEKALAGAHAATPVELQARRGAAAEAVAAFVALGKELPEGFRTAHPFLAAHAKEIEAARGRFPVDSATVDRIGEALFDGADPEGVWGTSPPAALNSLEQALRGVERTEGPRLTREARRKLVTCLLVARATRLLLAGRSVDDVAGDEGLRELVAPLRDAGGPLPELMGRVSPKIRAVADKIAR